MKFVPGFFASIIKSFVLINDFVIWAYIKTALRETDTKSTWKLSFLSGPSAYFQGRTVSFRECTPHRIHVWYIYPHFMDFCGKSRYIYQSYGFYGKALLGQKCFLFFCSPNLLEGLLFFPDVYWFSSMLMTDDIWLIWLLSFTRSVSNGWFVDCSWMDLEVRI